MVNALNVANSILDRAKKENCRITPMKLQKLTYFVYKRYLQKTKHPLFSERFEAWQYGPVVCSVYNAFKKYGARRIKDFYFTEDGKAWKVNENSDADFLEALNYVWDRYSRKDGISLSKLTHKIGTAWYKALKNEESFLNDDNINSEEWL